MKQVIFMILVIFTSGCTSDMDMAKQIVKCKGHSGVYSYGDFYVKLKCKDGTRYGKDEWFNVTGIEVAKELEIIENNESIWN